MVYILLYIFLFLSWSLSILGRNITKLLESTLETSFTCDLSLTYSNLKSGFKFIKFEI